MELKEVERFSAYGTANQKRKQIEEAANEKAYIFKDLTNGPFTSFRDDQYVVAVEIDKDAKT